MTQSINWNLKRVKQLVREETDAKTIMEETGIKQNSLKSIVVSMSRQNHEFYHIKGLFDETNL